MWWPSQASNLTLWSIGRATRRYARDCASRRLLDRVIHRIHGIYSAHTVGRIWSRPKRKATTSSVCGCGGFVCVYTVTHRNPRAATRGNLGGLDVGSIRPVALCRFGLAVWFAIEHSTNPGGGRGICRAATVRTACGPRARRVARRADPRRAAAAVRLDSSWLSLVRDLKSAAHYDN